MGRNLTGSFSFSAASKIALGKNRDGWIKIHTYIHTHSFGVCVETIYRRKEAEKNRAWGKVFDQSRNRSDNKT